MSQQPQRPAPPPITDQMREEARQTPGTWLYIVDPGYQESGDEVPPEGVIGAYRIDDSGEIDEDFQFNDEYVPSEMAVSLPEPTNDLEQVLHRIATGQAPESDLPPAVLDAEILLYAEEGEDDAIFAAEMDDGSQLVPACTSESRVPRSWPGFRRVPGADLPEVLSGLDLGLNVDDAIRAIIPHSVLVQAAAERG
ncbi:hypothetical protein A8924_0118 [Saccharopolyspora erythraea NRRL 2338]|uniref:SseB protein N-terminal domain-containing protein n=3 Tax=Saccharopolyspora erythraea TaxID=1836 RepID=A4FQG8_SACEN|nr:type VII secretion system-associated protein [Saccharopolyspora erythraea]EQD86617.1 hypothetical protein N599_08555 [Saccharopolyspora erythraea D]PFG92894.1 hypothetical protein A8924_0118 [Saccharopolyspora erythraea NRRL 2338]QRK89797.1 SseB family protein [Saccharopolyspora erythraea]CAM06293.1 hypothetical protein SACE_7135 [Saccharopolyspora erythraea NRRL 2338]